MGVHKQFCPKGHDTHKHGRTKNGLCAECNRIRARNYYNDLPKDKKQKRNNEFSANRAYVRRIIKEEKLKQNGN